MALLCIFPLYVLCLVRNCGEFCTKLVDSDAAMAMRETMGRQAFWAFMLHAPLGLSVGYLVASSQAYGNGAIELGALITVICDGVVSVSAHCAFLLNCVGDEPCCASTSKAATQPATAAATVRDDSGAGIHAAGASV